MAAGARRVGVIGAGMVGVCVALYLQRDGHSVFLVEPGVPGGEAGLAMWRTRGIPPEAGSRPSTT